jgi:hypothetical protein
MGKASVAKTVNKFKTKKKKKKKKNQPTRLSQGRFGEIFCVAEGGISSKHPSQLFRQKFSPLNRTAGTEIEIPCQLPSATSLFIPNVIPIFGIYLREQKIRTDARRMARRSRDGCKFTAEPDDEKAVHRFTSASSPESSHKDSRREVLTVPFRPTSRVSGLETVCQPPVKSGRAGNIGQERRNTVIQDRNFSMDQKDRPKFVSDVRRGPWVLDAPKSRKLFDSGLS